MVLFRSHLKLGLASSDLCGGNFPIKGSLESAQKIMKGSLVVDAWIKDNVPFDLSRFDWGGAYGESPTTFQLYLQGLKPVSYLVGAYVLTRERRYYALAVKMFESWVRYEAGVRSRDNVYTWDQHAAALRSENILCLLTVGLESRLLSARAAKAMERILVRHGDYLADWKNYLPAENHGVFQDRALLYLGYALRNEEWVEIAIDRAFAQWDALFDSDMACVENSFLYHRVNKDLFIEIACLLVGKGRSEGEELQNKIMRAEDFMGYALMPNGVCPPYGDTLRDDYSHCAFLDAEGVLAYSSRKGESGAMPKSASIAYPQSGLYFGREHWGRSRGAFEDAVWTMFRAGYSSITHRQADDNSFMLYARGHEVFTDAGIYNYMYRHPMRRHVRSALAHNTLVVDEKSYDFLQIGNSGMAGFCHVSIGDGTAPDYIVGFNSLHFGVVHFRHFVYWKTVLVIVDEVWSRMPHTYSQLFYCGIDMVIEKSSAKSVVLGFPNETGSCVSLEQIGETGGVAFRELRGSSESFEAGMVYGAIGGDFNEALYTTTLKYDRFAEKCDSPLFATVIKVKDGEGPFPSCEVDLDSRNVVISLDGARRECVGLRRFDASAYLPAAKYAFDCVSVSQDGSRFAFEYVDDLPQGVELAWYVHGNYGKSVLHKGGYSTSRRFAFDFSEVSDSHCVVRLFLFQKQGKLKGSQCVVAVDCSEGVWSWSYWPDWDPGWKDWFGGTEIPHAAEGERGDPLA